MKIADIFSDHMVLQRDQPIRVWGTGEGEVTISLGGNCVRATCADGKWQAVLNPLPAGGPYELTVQSAHETRTIRDVLVGDVWIAAGQSNMEFPLLCEMRGLDEAVHAHYPNIRFFACPRSACPEKEPTVFAFEKRPSAVVPWQVCDPESALHFSAIGYFVAAELHKKLGVPIGMISLNRGGVRIESFVGPRELRDPVFQPYWEIYERQALPDDEAEAYMTAYGRESDAVIRTQNTDILTQIRAMGREASSVKGCHMLDMKLCRYHPNAPGLFYRRMLEAYVVPYGIKGVLWYQGEQNVGDDAYADKFRRMAESWRAAFRSQIPFYTVEIAPYPYDGTDRAPILRAEQWRAAATVSDTYITSTQDLGDEFDIHPSRKKEIAKRLINQILAHTYGEPIRSECPSYAGYTVHGNRIEIALRNGEGFFGRDVAQNMEICGADNVFRPAESDSTGGRLTVWSKEIAHPTAVRYCWHPYYRRGGYYNDAGLPLAPFSTRSYRKTDTD